MNMNGRVVTGTAYMGSFWTLNGAKSSRQVLTPAGYVDLSTGHRYWYLTNRQGSTTAVVDETGAVVQRNGYYPSGTPFVLPTEAILTTPQAMTEVTDQLHIGNRWMDHSGLNLYDNTARMHDPILMRFASPDPLFAKYPGISPWTHCSANPANAVDPDGRDWYRTEDFQIKWTNYNSQKQLSEHNIKGTYLGKAHVYFEGSRSECLGTKNGKYGYIDGKGAITAKVTLYGPNGEDDIHTMTGYTMTSDAEKFGAIDEGLYPANFDPDGKSGALKSNWVLNERNSVRMLDGEINPNAPKQINSQGEGYKTGIFIHSTNASGYAYGKVSVGCLLLTPADFKKFNAIMNGVQKFSVQVSRIVSKPFMIPLLYGTPYSYLKHD